MPHAAFGWQGTSATEKGAVVCSILVSVWHLMNALTGRYRDLGADFHTRNLAPHRRSRDLVRQLKALGHNGALTPAAA
ncbi:hypothetical protein OG407_48165 [Streptomyces sp. NBC_01515]|uniref:hypothetical protein n=1 Tax=Streptomyces sp. NBC_01515 TaxID=2903890 RepID=UPI00386F210D